MRPKDLRKKKGRCHPSGISLADLRHRLSTLDRVKLDAYIERMVEAFIGASGLTFGPSQALTFDGNIRVSGKAFMGETGIRVSMESEGELFSKPLEKIASLGFRPSTPDRLGGNYIIGEKPR